MLYLAYIFVIITLTLMVKLNVSLAKDFILLLKSKTVTSYQDATIQRGSTEENVAPQCYGCNVMQQGQQFFV